MLVIYDSRVVVTRKYLQYACRVVNYECKAFTRLSTGHTVARTPVTLSQEHQSHCHQNTSHTVVKTRVTLSSKHESHCCQNASHTVVKTRVILLSDHHRPDILCLSILSWARSAVAVGSSNKSKQWRRPEAILNRLAIKFSSQWRSSSQTRTNNETLLPESSLIFTEF